MRRARDSAIGAPSQTLASKLRRQMAEADVDVEECQGGWSPPNWRQVWHNIRQMRCERDAPVDLLGADSYMKQDLTPSVCRLHVLVHLVLSSQTRDEQNAAAVARLSSLPGGLTVDTLLSVEEQQLQLLLRPVGFYRRKAGYLKQIAERLRADYEDDVPCTLSELCQLPGVGPKMAHLCMSAAWNTVTGIAVDVHVHRISNRLGWVQQPTKSETQTQKALECWVPKNMWKDVNLLLVGFGQQMCSAKKPRCDLCSNSRLCPASTVKPV